MNKELKELILKLEFLGLEDECSKLKKIASTEAKTSYLAEFEKDRYSQTRKIIESLPIDDNAFKIFLKTDPKGLSGFATKYAEFISENLPEGAWSTLQTFKPNRENNPVVLYGDTVYADKDKRKKIKNSFVSKETDTYGKSFNMYFGYPNDGKEAFTIDLGFATYYFRKGYSNLYGYWLSLVGRRKNEAGFGAFFTRNKEYFDNLYNEYLRKEVGNQRQFLGEEADIGEAEGPTTDKETFNLNVGQSSSRKTEKSVSRSLNDNVVADAGDITGQDIIGFF